MKNKELFDKTVSILVKSYFDNTLQKGSCAACAVGNIVAANMGLTYAKDSKGIYTYRDTNSWWNSVFSTVGGTQTKRPHRIFGCSKRQIDSTGYHWEDLAKIEFAFETASNDEGDEGMFLGLMAVIDVLCEIHECEENKEETKLLFNN